MYRLLDKTQAALRPPEALLEGMKNVYEFLVGATDGSYPTTVHGYICKDMLRASSDAQFCLSHADSQPEGHLRPTPQSSFIAVGNLQTTSPKT